MFSSTPTEKLGCLIYTSCSSTTSTHLATMAFAVASRRSSVLVQAKKGGKAKAPAKVRYGPAGALACVQWARQFTHVTVRSYVPVSAANCHHLVFI
jgi:hypothetical protein